jgi:glucose/arabinose dehydrogenase
MLITEKVGPVWLVIQTGEKTPVANVPPVLAQGQGGMLGVFLSPHYAEDRFVYLTYGGAWRRWLQLGAGEGESHARRRHGELRL